MSNKLLPITDWKQAYLKIKATDDLTNSSSDSGSENLNTDESEKISVSLYNELSSTIYNCLSSSIVRNEIKNNQEILNDLKLQISNLFYLEKQLKSELGTTKFSLTFLQVISNLTKEEISIKKSDAKNRIDILEDRNLLVVTLVNTCKGVSRESLELERNLDENSVASLEDQINALTNFNSESKDKNNTTSINNNQNNSAQTAAANNLFTDQNKGFNPNLNILNIPKELLPENPLQNERFYPYTSKPIYFPFVKKVLGILITIGMLLIILTLTMSFFISGNIKLVADKDAVAIKMSSQIQWLVPIVSLVLLGFFTFYLFRPNTILKDTFHLSTVYLVLLIFWLAILIFNFVQLFSDNNLTNMLQMIAGNDKDNKLLPSALSDFKNLSNFSIAKTFSLITAGFLSLPIMTAFYLILINPKLDQKKIALANLEYQKALSAAFAGQKYNIDPSLFDQEETPKKPRSFFKRKNKNK